MSERNRILFVGYSCLDFVYVCDHYPEEDTDQRAVYNVWRRGGNASNNCTVFRQLLKMCPQELKVEYFGTFGDDFPSKFITNDFKENEIIIENVVIHEGKDSPTTSVIINEENGSRTLVHFNKNLPELTFESFSELCLANYKAIHFEGLRNVSEIAKMVRYIREKDPEIKISVELEKPVIELQELLDEDIDIFFIERDFAKLFNYLDSEQTVKEISKRVHSKALVICPWAETGAKAIDNQNGQLVCSPAFTPRTGVVDTLGAGDTFLSSTLFAIHVLKLGLKESIELGCQVAGAKCGQLGYQHLHQFHDYIIFEEPSEGYCRRDRPQCPLGFK